MRHTLGTAATATGKSKSTILRAVQNGTLSASKNDDGSYAIDPAELHRVFDPVDHEPADDTPRNPVETALVQVKLDAAERIIREQQTTISDLRTRLDTEGEERRQTLAILTDQREKHSEVEKARMEAQAQLAAMKEQAGKLEQMLQEQARIAEEARAKRGFFARIFGG